MANYQEVKLNVTVQGSPLAIDGKYLQKVITDAVKKLCSIYDVQVEVKGDRYVTHNNLKEENGK